MRKTLLLFIFSTLLSAANPIVYAALGDLLYNNAQSIKKLQAIPLYTSQTKIISDYLTKLEATKKMGFAIEMGDTSVDKKVYLQDLRALSKKNDAFVRSANTSFRQALENEDSTLFAQLVNSGLIDIKKHKNEILHYYYNHNEDMNITDVIDQCLGKDKRSVNSRKKGGQYARYKKRKEQEKIHRIRVQDAYDQAKLEKKLDAELRRKKREIQKEKEKSLFR